MFRLEFVNSSVIYANDKMKLEELNKLVEMNGKLISMDKAVPASND